MVKRMEWKVEFSPSYSMLKVELNPGERITAEPGAMVLTKGGIKVETKMSGGVMKALTRKFLGGESIFMNNYVAEDKGMVWLAPPFPGDIKYIKLENDEIYVQDMAYLAHHGEVDIGTKFKGFKGLFGAGEVFWLSLKGVGGVWINGFGGIDIIELEPGEKVTIDNFHALAIEKTVKWNIKKFGGWKSFLLGGEGLVIEAKGPGRIFVQSRIIPELVRILMKFLPKK